MDLETLSFTEKLELAANSSTPLDVLRALAKDEDNWIRIHVAENSNTPVDLLPLFK